MAERLGTLAALHVAAHHDPMGIFAAGIVADGFGLGLEPSHPATIRPTRISATPRPRNMPEP